MYCKEDIYKASDGEVPYFYGYSGLMHEYGDGVSTSKNAKWSILLRKDWTESD